MTLGDWTPNYAAQMPRPLGAPLGATPSEPHPEGCTFPRPEWPSEDPQACRACGGVDETVRRHIPTGGRPLCMKCRREVGCY